MKIFTFNIVHTSDSLMANRPPEWLDCNHSLYSPEHNTHNDALVALKSALAKIPCNRLDLGQRRLLY